MKCPACGAKGKPESRTKPGEDAAFELRGQLGNKVVVRCLRCDGGFFSRPFGSQQISPDQWSKLDEFWRLRREILAQCQSFMKYANDPPPDEVVAQSQTWFGNQKLNEAQFVHTMRRAGYDSADAIIRLTRDNPVEARWLSFQSLQGRVVFNDYEALLDRGGVDQTDAAAARIAAARKALTQGETGGKAFLAEAVSD